MSQIKALGLTVLAVALAIPAAHAGSISGTVQNSGGQPLSGIQVRLWAPGAKGYAVAQAVATDAQGVYSVGGIVGGTYKLDARMGPGMSGNYGDRWYDVDPPSSDGYVGADADLIAVGDLDALAGYDFTLEVLGGFDGQVQVQGSPAPGVRVRGERAGEPRIHHNDLTHGGPHAGRFYLRGMVPEADYRFFAHEVSGNYETLVHEGPFVVGAGVNTVLPSFALQPASADPNEPNDGPLTATAVDPALWATNPTGTYTSAGARIGPRNSGDTDWYCWQAEVGERFWLHAQADLTVAAGARENPFVDPVVAFFTGDGATLLGEDDDSGPGLRDARLDTGILSQAGRYCAVVTTYGDTTFTGQSQGSAGRYTLTVQMGNRRPSLSGTHGGLPLPLPPSFIEIDEGESLTLQFAYADADDDVLSAAASFLDRLGQPAAGDSFTAGAGSATWSWTASQVAAQGSPYLLTVEVQDAEFTETVTVVVTVNPVNLPPTTPVQQSPADGSTVATAAPSLVVENSTDPDLDVLQYEFELYYGASQSPDQTHLAMEGAGGTTLLVPDPIPENTQVRWRVRAYDGQQDSAYSPWSLEWTLFVDQQNDPPEAPTFLKPGEGEVVMDKRPALSASNPVDPEGDEVTLHFQLASDANFTQGLLESPAVEVSPAASSTTWNLPSDLPWGSWWFGRVQAKDSRGGVSGFSNVHRFRIKPNLPPSVPAFGAPFHEVCEGLLAKQAIGTVSVGPSEDPEGEAVSLQLQVLPFDQDPQTATPLYDQSADQVQGSASSFEVSSVAFAEDGRYLFRARAFDGLDHSEWALCDLVWDLEEKQEPTDGGDGSGGGVEVKEGCGCGSGGASTALLGLLLAGLLLARRRRAVSSTGRPARRGAGTGKVGT